MRTRLITAAGLASAALLASAGTAVAHDGPETVGVASHSPGVLSGNVIQNPVDVDLNFCGNSLAPGGLLSPVFGNVCVNRD
ncbi:chaplin [Streptomyces sp. NPDC101219]|uniref:chaplin n=1 Tax=Streptomyces sp. NPDC101219 TaxID=3366131 RepID=UPI003804AD8B